MLSTITGTVTTTVTPGSGNYAAVLTIANTAVVENPATAVSAGAFSVDLTNFGSISGDTWFFFNATLNNSGHMSGATAVSFGISDVLTNTGQIIGTQNGIKLGSSGHAINSGLIEGGNMAVFASVGSYILNTGSILQAGAVNGPVQFGVVLDGAVLRNTNTVSGLYAAIAQNGSSIFNSGTILGRDTGIVGSGSNLVNNSGHVSGNSTGIYFAGGTILNSGTITAAATGINAKGSEQIINSGVIYGVGTAIGLLNGGVVTNSGTISSSSDALLNSNTSLALTLTVDPGAHFSGQVQDNSQHGTLVLGGSGAGVLNMNASFSGFSEIDFSANTTWTLEGSTQELASGETISGFGLHETIVLDSFAATSDTFISNTGLVLSKGAAKETLAIKGGFSTPSFAVTDVGGNTVVNIVLCFCAGTHIATARGNMPVESLEIGDLVKTATQGFQPIRWIGRRSYDGRFIAGNHLALPVKIRRHALGFNVPSRDLFVSPGHAICEGGVLIHAWRLVNGVSITQAERVERVEYYHIELDRHAVIFAENTPVESFLDNGCRAQFQNAASAPAAEPQTPCLPLIEEGYYLARLRARIDARAGIAPPAAPGPLRGNIDRTAPRLFGWAQDEAAPEVPVELELLCGGVVVARVLANRYRPDLRQAGLGSGCHAFELDIPPLPGPFTMRRMADGAVLGEAQGWMATRRAG